MLEDKGLLKENDFILQICSPSYRNEWNASIGHAGEDADVVRAHLKTQKVIPLLREGNAGDIPHESGGCKGVDFRDNTAFVVHLFELALGLYAIPLNHPAFKPLHNELLSRWGQDFKNRIESEKRVFISYTWGEEREPIVNELDREFKNRGVIITRDKRDLGFKGSIKGFMQSIGEGKAVVLVISEKYLKSPNCCFELVEIANRGHFKDRIFPIVLDDAKIYDPVDRARYVMHWERKKDQLEDVMKQVSAANMDGFREDIDLYTEIRALLPKLMDVLKDMNTLTPDLHRQSGFSEIFDAVMAKLEE